MDTTDLSLCDDDEDYIDMELCSSPQGREFEFQMSTACCDGDTTTSPADELFYKGKLLPLHLPPRRLMVQNLLHPPAAEEEDRRFYSTPFLSCSTAPCTSTPQDSCTISPSESCRVSCELNPDDYFFEWSNELNTLINNHRTELSWSKKVKLIKNSILGKASTAYLKSLFTKSSCSHESSAQSLPKPKESSSKNSKQKPLRYIPAIASVMSTIDKEGIEVNVSRRSFSSAIRRHSPTKCLSSSSSNSSSSSSSFSLNSHELHSLRRSSSATEIAGSIEAAIAHCKKSQQITDSRNPSGDQ